ncbi:MAG TPA: patatin-like phospholipase family protein [Bryobacteraceae bacterium]
MTNDEKVEKPVDNVKPDGDGPVSFDTVAVVEKIEIDARREEFGLGVGKDFLGLAISGGGIRSATFSLGIIQMLAKSGLLKHVDYISTVSGGGYIGAWLYSWIRRCQAEAGTKTAKAGQSLHKDAFEDINEKLIPQKTADEPREIAFLRQYSNYLTPRVSVFNADTWLVAAVWSRNTLLNLAILVAFFGAVVLAVRGIGWRAAKTLWPFGDDVCLCDPILCAGLLIPMIGLIGWNLWQNSTIALSLALPHDRGKKEASDTRVIWFCIFPLLSAIAYSFWLDHDRRLFVEGTLWHGVWMNFAVLSIAYLILQICGRVYECHIEKKKEIIGKVPIGWQNRAFALVLYVIGPAAAGFVTAALLRAIAFIFDARHPKPDEPWFVLTWGPPLVLTVFAIGVIVHIGLMGRDLPEASREWLSRLRAWLMIFSFFWIAIFGVAIYGPWLVAWIGVKSKTAIGLGGGWLLTTAGGLFAGKSAKTSGKKEQDSTQTSRSSVFEILALVAPYLFMAGFSISVAFGIHVILVHKLPPKAASPASSQVEKYNLKVLNDNIQLTREKHDAEESRFKEMFDHYWGKLNTTEICVANQEERWLLSGLIPLLILLLVAGTLLAWRVDINNFSMHNFYKSRLVRCYLGASRGKRAPNPFTGFDDSDDAPLDLYSNQNLKPNQTAYYGPYPIVNAALNVTSGGKLQYQERQAQSFIFTPHFTGFSAEKVIDQMRLLDDTDSDAPTLLHYQDVKPSAAGVPGANAAETNGQAPAKACAYRPTEKSGGRISVGMAMAISGAAVNPNMGYHSSTAVSFLLTVFNVRLGWWLGNSLKSKFNSQGPSVGLIYSFRELFGLANANSSYVNLSDGGHFDNMGIYELVRRKCPYIICCDGEQDANMTFSGIGMAIRKCRTDFGVEIDLPLHRLHKVDGFSRVHCAVGRIKYPDSDPADEGGYIVYLKSTLTGDEPVDVLAYHSDQSEFPHQTTLDQFFDESQFESYRRLGCHVAGKAFSSSSLEGNNRQKFFEDLYQVWYPPSRAVDKNSAAHSDIYMRVLDAIRREEDLENLDPALFKDYKPTSKWNHGSGHICNGLIQLMERVFYDLGLEDTDERKHPYIKGWIEIFKHWVKQPAFEETWTVTQGSYPDRFRNFYNLLVKDE